MVRRRQALCQADAVDTHRGLASHQRHQLRLTPLNTKKRPNHWSLIIFLHCNINNLSFYAQIYLKKVHFLSFSIIFDLRLFVHKLASHMLLAL